MKYIIIAAVVCGIILIGFVGYKCFKAWCTKSVAVGDEVELMGKQKVRPEPASKPTRSEKK